MNFHQWHDQRQGIVNEGFMDWVKGLFKRPDGTPIEPKQIYTNQIVNKYFKEIISYLNLDKLLETIDDKGQVTGTYAPDSMPLPVVQAFKRFIAAHVLGKGQEPPQLR